MRPFWSRQMWICSNSIVRLLAGMPWKGPTCSALKRVRATTLSPLAITSCGVMEISANDALSQRTSPRKPSGLWARLPAGD